jgi:hypothetical protein
MNKGIIFSGDSFVWGEGLELFSELPSTQHYFDERKYSMAGPHNRAWSPDFTYSMKMYQQKNRFARLVANHFDTWEDVYDRNGGCPYTVVSELLAQIKRTPLTDVKCVVIHPTDPWRSTDLLPIRNPISKYFNSESDKGDWNDTKFSIPKDVPYHGTMKGYEIYPQLKNSEDFSSRFENNTYQLIRMCLAYNYHLNHDIDLQKAFETIGVEYNKGWDYLYEMYYKFTLLEYSNFGDNIEQIFENLEIFFCKQFLDFIDTHIKPQLDKHDVKLLYLPVWNETYKSYLKAGNEYYNDNWIPIYDEDKEYKSFNYIWKKYLIENTEGFEWTKNLHPNLDGHKVIAESIIKTMKEKNVFS